MQKRDDAAERSGGPDGAATLDAAPADTAAAPVTDAATVEPADVGREPPAGETGPPPGERALSRRSTWILVVCCVAQFMVILDLSIVNVALPSIQSSLNFSAPDLQWVVDAYAITFAGFLMLGGRAADHYGQRRTFVAALVLFAATSLAGGAAPSQGVLIAARAFQRR